MQREPLSKIQRTQLQNTTKTNKKYNENKYKIQQKQIQNTTKTNTKYNENKYKIQRTQLQNTTPPLMLSYAARAIFQKPSLEDDSKLLPSDEVVQVAD